MNCRPFQGHINQLTNLGYKFIKRVILIMILVLWGNGVCWGVEPAPRITGREIVERLTRLEEGQKAILREMDKRFESMDKRFESMENRFDQLINIMIAIISAFAGIVMVTIGFAIWDRRTMIRPFETKVKDIKGHLEEAASGAKGFKERIFGYGGCDRQEKSIFETSTSASTAVSTRLLHSQEEMGPKPGNTGGLDFFPFCFFFCHVFLLL